MSFSPARSFSLLWHSTTTLIGGPITHWLRFEKPKEKNNFALSAPLRVFRDVNTLRTSCIFKKCAGKRFEDLPRAQRRCREAHSYLHPPEEALLGGPQKTMLWDHCWRGEAILSSIFNFRLVILITSTLLVTHSGKDQPNFGLKTYHFVGKSRQTGGDPAAFPPGWDSGRWRK